MPHSIVLSTLNARYQHSSFGLRYLYANLKELQSICRIVEFTTSQNPRDIVEKILALQPTLVGFGVYIWNTQATLQVISLLKKMRPDLKIVLGGPEVSYESEGQAICQLADHVFQGEADLEFYHFCKNWIEHSVLPSARFIACKTPEILEIASPYPYYSPEDLAHRIIYVEASRGCPYKCEYCLSSLDRSVRSFNLDYFLGDMDSLIQKGVRQFKFVDRTFNLSIATSTRILQFFLDRIALGLFLHFEMVPDRLPKELRALIVQFPRGSLQFEIGIQTWSPQVAQLVSRRQDYSKIQENLAFLTRETGVHIHADLIAGLPGETWESFGQGFDRVAEMRPHEIQVGILKRLKGTPIIRHDQSWQMLYEDHPPFQVLQTRSLSFELLQKISRFAQFWDLIGNSGNFTYTTDWLRRRAVESGESFFASFFALSEFLSARHPQGNGVALLNLLESVWIYFTEYLRLDLSEARSLLVSDYSGSVKRDIPRFLREDLKKSTPEVFLVRSSLPKRQAKHSSEKSLNQDRF